MTGIVVKNNTHNDIDNYFYKMKLGSVIKITSVTLNPYIMRVQDDGDLTRVGVCIFSKEDFDVGTFWGNLLEGYTYEIIKEIK